MKTRLLAGVIALALVAVGIAEARKRARVAEPSQSERADAAMVARIAAVKKTEGMILDKLGARTKQVRQRVRSLYKLMRAGPAPLWVEPSERSATVRRRAAATRILRRDLRELHLLRDELRVAQTARVRLLRDRRQLAKIAWPEPRSLLSPVDGRVRVAARFGEFEQKRPQRLMLTRRGMALRVKKGVSVHPVAPGRVRYAGTIRGLGIGVIIDHGGYLSVVGPLDAALVTRLQQVGSGAELGVAAGDQLYMEVRVSVGAGGLPVDPAPLLRRR